ncbi:MAG TPA: S8 family serine peptidase [Actinomycetota bacterium]|nr:S8 family serine peptidase [Actinomycetota bacterium]
MTLLAALFSQTVARSAPEAPVVAADASEITERVIIFDGVNPVFMHALKSVTDYELVHEYEIIRGVAVSVPAASVESVISFAQRNGLRAERDMEIHADLSNSARTVYVKANGVNSGAWGLGYTGAGVTVAIIDSGLYAQHQSLDDQDDNSATNDPKIVLFKDYVNAGGAEVAPYDDNDHGTHVAGIASGTGGGGANIGMAYRSNLAGFKVFNAAGAGSSSSFIAAVNWIVQNGHTVDPPIRVINYSGGSTPVGGNNNGNSAQSLAVDAAMDAGFLVAVAGGNGSQDGAGPNQVQGNVNIPADSRKGVAVCSSNSANPPAAPTYSNWDSEGPTGDGRIKPDVCAPGDGVNSANSPANGGLPCPAPLSCGGPNSYANFGGTSMSSPHVAGIAALIFQAAPNITANQMRQVLFETALLYPTKDNNRGYGGVNARAAIELAIARHGGSSPLSVTANGPYTAIQGEPVTVTATATGGVPPHSYAWDLDNNGSFETAGKSVSFPHTATSGAKIVKVRVTDSAGTPSTSTATGTVNVLSRVDVFSDSVGATDNGWTSNDATLGWHRTEVRAKSPTWSWYPGNDVLQLYMSNTDTTMTRTVDLSALTGSVRLRFARSGDIEPDFDYLRVKAKRTADASYTTLAEYSDMLGSTWQTETVDLSAFAGSQINLQFQFFSDEFIEETGPFLDDFEVFGTGSPVVDTTPPGAIGDLSPASVTESSVTLSWTATGDDGAVGRASFYDIRYSTTPISAANFDAATPVPNAPEPLPSGSAESFAVTGLVPNTQHYFAVKAIDDGANYGPISNVPSATTLADLAAPSQVTGLTGTPGNRSATVSWAAATDNVAVAGYEVFKDGVLAASPTGTAATITGLTNGVSYEFKVRAKDTAGNVGAFSDPVSVIPEAPAPVTGWLMAGGDAARTGFTPGAGSIAVPNILQTLTAPDAILSSPLIVDLDRDGRSDVVVVQDATSSSSAIVVRAYRQTATGLVPMWSSPVPQNPALGQPATGGFARIAAGDLDGNGTPEIVVNANYETRVQGTSLNDGTVRLLRGSDGALLGQPVATTIGLPVSPAIGDLDGNPDTLEVAYTHQVGGTSSGYYVSVLSYNGTALNLLMDLNVGANALLASPALADLRPTAGNEIVVAESAGTQRVLICSAATGTCPAANTLGVGQSVRGLSVADLNNDGVPEIVANATQAESLKVIRTSPTLSAVGRADGYLWNTASLRDVDGDGFTEIVNVNYSEFVNDFDRIGNVAVRGYNGSAVTVKGNLTRTPPPGESSQSRGGASLADIAGDGRPEMIFGAGNGRLVAVQFNASGVPSELWSVALGSPAINAPVAVGDVTGDGRLDLVTAGSDGRITVIGAGPLASIRLSPATATVSAGQSQSYTVEGFDSVGNSLGDVTAATTLSITGGTCSGASCSSTQAGDRVVTATYQGKTANATLTVTPGPLASMTIAPSSSAITAGASQAYMVTGADAYGNSLGDVTPGTGFSITPNGSCSANTCTATVSGPHTVTATRSSVTVQASLQVNPGPLASLALSPAATTVVLGNGQAYTAQGRDAFGNSLGDLTAGTTFAIFPDGSCNANVCTPARLGDHTVRAARGMAQGSAIMHVIPDTIHRIVISPANATITAGDSQAFTAEGFDGDGNSVGDVTGATVFTIGPDGSCSANVCTATVAGNKTVLGAVAQTSAAAGLKVVAGPMTGISLTPAVSQIPSGGTRVYTVLGRDQYGNATGDVTSSATLAIAPDGSCSAASCTATAYGDHTVTATVTPHTATATLKVVPQAPSITTPAAGSVNGSSIEVTGGAPAGTTITLWDNGFKIAENVAVAPDGSWAVTRSFAEGNHSMTAFAVAGSNVSAPSPARLFSVDATAPTTTIYRRQGYVVAQVYHPLERVVVEGVARDTTSGVAEVEVSYAGTSTVVDRVACSGPCTEFRWTSTPNLAPGVYTVRAVPIDRAGNRGSAATITIASTSLISGGGGSASSPASIRPNVVE